MKTVFSTTVEVCAVWAAQDQPEGRTGSNTSFRDQTLRSYGTPIARILNASKGRRVALVSSEQWSSGTSKVQGEAVAAARAAGYPVFRVPALGAEPNDLAFNIRALERGIDDTLKALVKGRPTSVASYRRAAHNQVAVAREYAATFGSRWRWKGPDPETVLHASETQAR